MWFPRLTMRLLRALPAKVAKHYVMPLLVKHQETYDARTFFSSYYELVLPHEFSDRITIGWETDPLHSRHHYNAVENSILAWRVSPQGQAGWHAGPSVLDVGSGAGHWIRFYLDVLGASSVCSVDISAPCTDALAERFADNPKVRIFEGDVSAPGFDLKQRFHVINAIGVMFHIVDDVAWRRAVRNLARHLESGGVLVIGGEFGPLTQNVQSHPVDDWKQFRPGQTAMRVNKRIRSLRDWKRLAREAGMRVEAVQRTPRDKHVYAPENNVLIMRRV